MIWGGTLSCLFAFYLPFFSVCPLFSTNLIFVSFVSSQHEVIFLLTLSYTVCIERFLYLHLYSLKNIQKANQNNQHRAKFFLYLCLFLLTKWTLHLYFIFFVHIYTALFMTFKVPQLLNYISCLYIQPYIWLKNTEAALWLRFVFNCLVT